MVSVYVPGVQQGSKMGGDNVPPLVEIGLTDPPKSVGGGARAPPRPPTLLHACVRGKTRFEKCNYDTFTIPT